MTVGVGVGCSGFGTRDATFLALFGGFINMKAPLWYLINRMFFCCVIRTPSFEEDNSMQENLHCLNFRTLTSYFWICWKSSYFSSLFGVMDGFRDSNLRWLTSSDSTPGPDGRGEYENDVGLFMDYTLSTKWSKN